MESETLIKFLQEKRFNVSKFGVHKLDKFVMDSQKLRLISLKFLNLTP